MAYSSLHGAALTSLKILMVIKSTSRPLEDRRKPMTAPERKAVVHNKHVRRSQLLLGTSIYSWQGTATPTSAVLGKCLRASTIFKRLASSIGPLSSH